MESYVITVCVLHTLNTEDYRSNLHANRFMLEHVFIKISSMYEEKMYVFFKKKAHYRHGIILNQNKKIKCSNKKIFFFP